MVSLSDLYRLGALCPPDHNRRRSNAFGDARFLVREPRDVYIK